MDYEKIKAVNEEIKTVDIRGKEYAEVAQRVNAYRKLEPNGAIITEMVSNENGVCVFKATVIDGNGKTLACGHAYEKEGNGNINKFSYIENCETSAVGRALGFCGIGSAASIASAEEVANDIMNQNRPAKNLNAELLEQAKELDIDLAKVAVYLKKTVSDLTNDDLADCIARKRAARGEQ